MNPFSIAIHGGAGTILPSSMSAEKEQAFTQALEDSVRAGHAILAMGGKALDAVQSAVESLENSPLFNAGRGAVYTHEGHHELDASLMDGSTLGAGAVAGVRRIKNPIALCREILEKSEHVFLSGTGAEEFAEKEGMALVNSDYFASELRWEQLLKIRDGDASQLDHSEDELKKYGTVGAVALDMHGNMAAATSTGGLTNKRYGRIGDTAIIGAGTYAENGVCAVSSTGWGEFYIRTVAAYEVAALMKYAGLSLHDATEKVISERILSLGGDGGLIAVDKNGEIAMPFNTRGMYRASIDKHGKLIVAIYR